MSTQSDCDVVMRTPGGETFIGGAVGHVARTGKCVNYCTPVPSILKDDFSSSGGSDGDSYIGLGSTVHNIVSADVSSVRSYVCVPICMSASEEAPIGSLLVVNRYGSKGFTKAQEACLQRLGNFMYAVIRECR